MSNSTDKERARQRAQVVFAVRSGQITADEGARQLGVSRKTYYEWESRALRAMTEAMENRPPGRPGNAQDGEKQRLEQEVSSLKEKLFVAEKTQEVRDMVHAYDLHCAKKDAGTSPEKKRRRRKRR